MTSTLSTSPGVEGMAATPRLKWRWVLTALVAGSVVVALTWLIAFSTVLGARSVRIRGTHTLTVVQVRSAAGIGYGTPLARLDTAAVAHRIEALPDVADAHVDISYPSTVFITVRERVAIGYLALNTGAILVDATGRQFRTTPAIPVGLPRFDLPPGGGGEAAARAVAVVASVLPASVRAALVTIRCSDPAAVTLVLRDGRTVQWGSVDRSLDKAAVLPALLGRPGTLFDVSDPDLAVAR